MISFAIVKTVFSSKLAMWIVGVGMALFAVTEAFLGQLIIALIGALIGAAPATWAIIVQSRKQSDERRVASKQASDERAKSQEALLLGQKKMAEEFDGKFDELRKAEIGQAKAEAITQGEEKERARVAAIPAPTPDHEAVQKMEIVNKEDNAVPTRSVEPKAVPPNNATT